MKLNYDRNQVESLLKSLGMRKEDCLHWAGILSKWDTYRYFPDSEVKMYLKMFRVLVDDPLQRMWSRHSYQSCYYMWQELAKIWDYRKSLPLAKKIWT